MKKTEQENMVTTTESGSKSGLVQVSKGKWLIEHVSFGQALLVLLAFGLLARFGALLPGLALDDYLHQGPTPPSTYDLYLSQGRGGAFLIAKFLDLFAVPLAGTYVLGTVALTLAMSLFYLEAVRFLGFGLSPAAVVIVATAITSPYVTEIFTFRVAGLIVAIAFTLAFVALRVLSSNVFKSSRSRFLISTACVIASLAFYQSVINYLIVVTLCAFIVFRKTTPDGLELQGFRNATLLGLVFIGAGVVYFALTKLGQWALGVSSASRATVISLEDVPERLSQAFRLWNEVLFRDEPVLPVALKSALGLCLILVWAASAFNPKSLEVRGKFIRSTLDLVGFAIIFFITMPGVTVLFNDWWPVPRVIMHASLFLAIVFLYFSSTIEKSVSAMISIIGTGILLVMILLSQNIFIDQQRLNKLDESAATQIANRLEEFSDGSSNVPVVLYGSFYSYPNSGIRTVQGDLNNSAFAADWTKYKLLERYSQRPISRAVPQVENLGQNLCKNKQSWPSAESMFAHDGAIFVCLIISE